MSDTIKRGLECFKAEHGNVSLQKKVEITLPYIIKNLLIFSFMNGAFIDFFLSEINKEELTTKE